MAKKINEELAKTLKNLGITAKTEEEARKKLIAALEKEGIEGMEDESLSVLMDMADGFLGSEEEDEIEETEDEVEDSDEEMDELADEVENEETEAEAEVEDEAETEDEVETEEKVETESKKKPSAAKTKKKNETKSKESKESKESPKPKKSGSRGVKLDPKNNPEDRKELLEIKDMFGENYTLDYVNTNGATVKYAGKNGKRGAVKVENLTKHNNGTVTANLYLLTMNKQTDVLDELNIDYELCWTKCPMIKSVTIEEIKEIIKSVLDVISEAVTKIDKRLGNNRKKMEENLKKTEKKVKKVAIKSVAEDADKNVEAPVKKSKKTK